MDIVIYLLSGPIAWLSGCLYYNLVAKSYLSLLPPICVFLFAKVLLIMENEHAEQERSSKK